MKINNVEFNEAITFIENSGIKLYGYQKATLRLFWESEKPTYYLPFRRDVFRDRFCKMR